MGRLQIPIENIVELLQPDGDLVSLVRHLLCVTCRHRLRRTPLWQRGKEQKDYEENGADDDSHRYYLYGLRCVPLAKPGLACRKLGSRMHALSIAV